MDYTTGSIAAHTWAQSTFSLPVSYKNSRSKHPVLSQRVEWDVKNGRWSAWKLSWFASKYFVTTSGICALMRLIWHLKYWNQVKDFEVVGLDAFSLTMCIMCGFADLRLKFLRNRINITSDICIAFLSSWYYSGALFYVVAPFLRNFDMNQALFLKILKLSSFDLNNETLLATIILILVKIISSSIYVSIYYY